jgi:hypothetical protein
VAQIWIGADMIDDGADPNIQDFARLGGYAPNGNGHTD